MLNNKYVPIRLRPHPLLGQLLLLSPALTNGYCCSDRDDTCFFLGFPYASLVSCLPKNGLGVR